MSCHFLTGKPGGGKTLYAMALMGDELLCGNRHIVTNIPVNLPELAAWVDARRPGQNVMERVHLLDDAKETGKFWCYRPGGEPLPFVGKEHWQEAYAREHLAKAYADALPRGGVLWIIDEVHNFFGARDWMKTGPDVLYFLSQHRRFGDTVILITQSLAFVESQFRALAQDTCVLSNLGKSKAFGFRLPRLFLRSLYNGSKEATIALERKVTVLDTSLAACYNTAAGVGIHGRRADIGERLSGAPWWAGVLILTVLLILAFRFIPPAVAHAFGGLGDPLFKPARAVTSLPVTNQPVIQPTRPTTTPPPPPAPFPASTNRVTGLMVLGRTLYLTLSDGHTRRLAIDDSGPSWVRIGNRLYSYADLGL